MKFNLDGLEIYFPYDYIYPEQYRYMLEAKKAIDANGHSLLELPTLASKALCMISLITSYQFKLSKQLSLYNKEKEREKKTNQLIFI